MRFAISYQLALHGADPDRLTAGVTRIVVNTSPDDPLADMSAFAERFGLSS